VLNRIPDVRTVVLRLQRIAAGKSDRFAVMRGTEAPQPISAKYFQLATAIGPDGVQGIGDGSVVEQQASPLDSGLVGEN
jgi:hypothetical protein